MQKNEITFEELMQMREAGAIIIDVRNKRAFNENHIKGSINIPEYEINKSFQNFIKDKNIHIVFYCESGYRSETACKKVRRMGYINVYNLRGGLEAY